MPFFEMLISNCDCGKGSDGLHRCNGDVIVACKEGHNWTPNERKNVVKVKLASWAAAVAYHEPIYNAPDADGERTVRLKCSGNLVGVSPDSASMKTIDAATQLEKKS